MSEKTRNSSVDDSTLFKYFNALVRKKNTKLTEHKSKRLRECIVDKPYLVAFQRRFIRG